MFPVPYKTGKRLSMGYNFDRNLRIIRKIKFMDEILTHIESRGHRIDFIGGQHYQMEGKLVNHRDKKRYRFRWVFNLGCINKKVSFVTVVRRFCSNYSKPNYSMQFHLKCTKSGSEIALGVEHGTVVILHAKGGGPDAKLKHGGLGDPGCSYIIILETSMD